MIKQRLEDQMGQDILSYMASLPEDLALMGDFNLCIDASSYDSRQLTDADLKFQKTIVCTVPQSRTGS